MIIIVIFRFGHLKLFILMAGQCLDSFLLTKIQWFIIATLQFHESHYPL